MRPPRAAHALERVLEAPASSPSVMRTPSRAARAVGRAHAHADHLRDARGELPRVAPLRLGELVLGAEVARTSPGRRPGPAGGARPSSSGPKSFASSSGIARRMTRSCVRFSRSSSTSMPTSERPPSCRPAGRAETKRRLLRAALEGDLELRRVLPAHREDLGELAPQEVLADAPIGGAPAVRVGRVPAAQRERQARVEQQHRDGEQHHGHHDLDQREPAAARLTGSTPARAWRARATGRARRRRATARRLDPRDRGRTRSGRLVGDRRRPRRTWRS